MFFLLIILSCNFTLKMYELTMEISEAEVTTNPPKGVNEFKADTEV